MKKFFEKHDLFKIIGIFLLISVILTWVCSASYYKDGSLITDEITRVGLFDIASYSFLGFYYFPAMGVFLFMVGGFYMFLGSTDAYQELTRKIAERFKGKEKLFVAITMLIFGLLATVVNELFLLAALIPFAISILSKLNVDKVTGVSATIGGVLVGVLGSLYSPKIGGFLFESFPELTYGYELLSLIILFVIAYVLLAYFTISRMSKISKNDKTELLVDPFAKEVPKSSKKSAKVSNVTTLPIAIILFILFAILILAYISWDKVFGVTVFTDAFNWVNTATIADTPIFSYILGGFNEFGNWDLFGSICMMLLAILLVKVVYHISFDDVIESVGNGFKKIGKTVLLVTLTYVVLEISVLFPTIPSIVDWIMGLGANIITLVISGIVTAIFTVDFQFTSQVVGNFFATFENMNVAALALQASYGLTAFIAPTSAILVLGLSMLDVKYVDWFKHIWKYVVAMLVVVLIILAILMYV